MRKRKSLKIGGQMPMIVIPVSSRTIDKAIEADSHHCMIADAVKIRIPSAIFISVDLQSIRFTDSKSRVRYKYFTPLVGQQSLVNFDQGKKVKPFALTLKDGVQEHVPTETKKRKKRGDKRTTNHAARKPYKSRAKRERKFGLRNLE